MTLKLNFVAGADNTNFKVTSDAVISTIAYIEVLSNDGASSLCNIQPGHMAQSLSELGSNVFKSQLKGIQGGDEDNGATITAAAGFTSYLPINSFISDFSIMPAALAGNGLVVRVWWNSADSNLLKSADVSLASTSLLVGSWAWDQSIRQKLAATYLAARPLVWRFHQSRFQRSTEVMTPGQPFMLRLSGVTGLVSSVVVNVKIGNNSVKIAKLGLTSPSGENQNGGSPIDFAFADSILRAENDRHFPQGAQAFAAESSFRLPISTGADERDSGLVTAYVPMSGAHQLSIQLADLEDDSAQSAEITVLYTSLATFTVNRGVSSVQNS
jgi:hypothetical protein